MSNELGAINENLEKITKLIKQNMAIQLFTLGVNKDDIRKNLKMDQNEVYAVLKGVKKENNNGK